MAQPNSGDWPIVASQTSGDDLSDKLNRLSLAALSGFSGTGRPPGSTGGMPWVQEVSGGYNLMLWNGSANVELLRVRGTVVSGANFYTKTEIDNQLSALNTAIGNVSSVPQGAIMLWSGSIASIPNGYRLCDGGGGTPNLRNRFVIGAGQSYGVGSTGGKTAITDVPSHNHSFSATTSSGGNHNHGGSTENAGSHSHSGSTGSSGTNHRHSVGIWKVDNESANDHSSAPTRNCLTRLKSQSQQNFNTTYGGVHTHNLSINSAGNHSHTIANSGNHNHSVSGTTGNRGSSSVDIRPPYYGLAYIMKT